MAKKGWVGNPNEISALLKKGWVGNADNVACKIRKGWVGDENGKAQLIFGGDADKPIALIYSGGYSDQRLIHYDIAEDTHTFHGATYIEYAISDGGNYAISYKASVETSDASFPMTIYNYDKATKSYVQKFTSNIWSSIKSFVANGNYDNSGTRCDVVGVLSSDGSKLLLIFALRDLDTSLTTDTHSYYKSWLGYLLCDISDTAITPTTSSVNVVRTYTPSSSKDFADPLRFCFTASNDLSVFKFHSSVYDDAQSYSSNTRNRHYFQCINGAKTSKTYSSPTESAVTTDGKYMIELVGSGNITARATTVNIYLISGTTMTKISTLTLSNYIGLEWTNDRGRANGMRIAYDTDTERVVLFSYQINSSPYIFTCQLSETGATLLGGLASTGKYLETISKEFAYMMAGYYDSTDKTNVQRLWELSQDANGVVVGEAVLAPLKMSAMTSGYVDACTWQYED